MDSLSIKYIDENNGKHEIDIANDCICRQEVGKAYEQKQKWRELAVNRYIVANSNL